jgi:hypothetical protein
MLLTKIQVAEAIRYNEDKSGSLYNVVDLPWPWEGADPNTFAWVTAVFQLGHDLKVDGQLGPKTLKMILRVQDNTSVERPVKTNLSSSVEKAVEKFSNAIVVDGARVLLPDQMLDAGMTASNFLDDGEPYFKHRTRTKPLIHFVLHETCGNTAQGCKNTILRKGYGVQLILAHDGHLSCHGDLVRDRMVHANQLNDTSFGMEVVNPYAPKYVRDKSIWHSLIKALWWTWCPDKKDRRYVTPTAPQMDVARLLVPWLCSLTGVPYRFPTKGLNKKKRQIDGLTMKPKGRPGPGVVAHQDHSSHADGRYMLEDLIGRAG